MSESRQYKDRTSSGDSGRKRKSAADDPVVRAKIQELESSGEPLSLAETLSIEEAKSSSTDEEKRDIINVTELQKMTIKQLMAYACLLYTSPSPRDLSTSRMPSSA